MFINNKKLQSVVYLEAFVKLDANIIDYIRRYFSCPFIFL
jgi:hypothetical protein